MVRLVHADNATEVPNVVEVELETMSDSQIAVDPVCTLVANQHRRWSVVTRNTVA